jgi:hypothetical protein
MHLFQFANNLFAFWVWWNYSRRLLFFRRRRYFLFLLFLVLVFSCLRTFHLLYVKLLFPAHYHQLPITEIVSWFFRFSTLRRTALSQFYACFATLQLAYQVFLQLLDGEWNSWCRMELCVHLALHSELHSAELVLNRSYMDP